MKKMMNEFKEFIARGNVIDLAVGVVMGTAFSAIVTSLVNDIIMPLVGILIGGVDFAGLSVNIVDAKLMYGSFIQSVINFLIIAFCIFIFVKAMNKLNERVEKLKKKEEENKAEEKKSDEVLLLEEIRDLLKNNEKDKKNEKK